MYGEWLQHESAQRLQHGTRAGCLTEAIHSGVALSKKILDVGLGRIDHLSPIAATACVPRCRNYWEEGS
jgi:hypothetical protein